MQIAIGLGTLGVAIIVAILTWHQAYTNRLRLRHELFERRFAIFKDAQIVLSRFMEDLKIDGELYAKLADAWQRSRFLFDDDIPTYLDKIRESLVPFLKLQDIDRGKREKEHWSKIEMANGADSRAV